MNDIAEIVKKYKTYESELISNNVKDILKRKSKIHECNEIKEVNEKLNLNSEYIREIYKDDDIDWVSICKDIKNDFNVMYLAYWNDEYDCFEYTSIPVLICPYCGKVL